jgi:hypothetical protein
MLSVTFRISIRGKVHGGRRSIELAVTVPRASNGARRGLSHPDLAITHRQSETLRHGLLGAQYGVKSQYGSQRSPNGSGRTSQSVFSHRTSDRQTSKTGSVGALSRPTPIYSQTTTLTAGSSLVISTAGSVWGVLPHWSNQTVPGRSSQARLVRPITGCNLYWKAPEQSRLPSDIARERVALEQFYEDSLFHIRPLS